jgi:hypothetical protein
LDDLLAKEGHVELREQRVPHHQHRLSLSCTSIIVQLLNKWSAWEKNSHSFEQEWYIWFKLARCYYYDRMDIVLSMEGEQVCKISFRQEDEQVVRNLYVLPQQTDPNLFRETKEWTDPNHTYPTAVHLASVL